MIDRALSIPEGFFEARRDRMNGFRATGLAFGVALLLTAVSGVALRLLARQMTGTTEIDNPGRPSEMTCDTDRCRLFPAKVDLGVSSDRQIATTVRMKRFTGTHSRAAVTNRQR